MVLLYFDDNMKKFKIIFLISLIFLFFLLCFIPIQAETTYNWKVDPAIAFKLPAYNTIIKFDNYFYLNSFTWDSYNASMITFNNIQMAGGDALSSFGISVKNANATIVYLNTGGAGKIILSAPSGTESILTFIYPSNYPASIAITNTKSGVRQVIDSSYYLKDETTFSSHSAPAILLLENEKKIKIKNIHASDVEVDIYWMSAQLPSSAGGIIQYFNLLLNLVKKSGDKLLQGKVKLFKGSTLVDEKPVETGKVVFANLQAGTYRAMVYDENGELVGDEEVIVEEGKGVYTITVQEKPVELIVQKKFWENLKEFLTSPPLPIIMIILLFFFMYILTKIPWKKAWEKEVIVYG
jgi:hypothetical protein